MNVKIEDVLKPIELLKKMYSTNQILSQYIKIFDEIIEKEKFLFDTYAHDKKKYHDALKNYKDSLVEKYNKNTDPNLYDIYNAEINLININLKKLKD